MVRMMEKQGARTVLEPAGIALDEVVKLHRWGHSHLGGHHPAHQHDKASQRSFR